MLNNLPTPYTPQSDLRRKKSFTFLTHAYLLCLLFCQMLYSSPTWADHLYGEHVGGINLHQTLPALTELLGKPWFSREIYDKAAKCWVSIAHFEKERKTKVQVEFCRTPRKLKIRSLRAIGDSLAKTSKNVGMGSYLTDLIKAYKNVRIIGEDCLVVEDRKNTLTLRFILENGRVSEINFYLDPTLREDDFSQTDFSNIF